MCFACSRIWPWHVTREFTQQLHIAKVTNCHCEYFMTNGIQELNFQELLWHVVINTKHES